MARIPQNFIDELLTRVNVVDVIDKSVPLKKKGTNYSARCPFHNEKTPSFSVSLTKQFYYCFGCGASGNAIGFLIDYERMNFVEAVKTLAGQVGMEVPIDEKDDENHHQRRKYYVIMEQANDFYQSQLRQHSDAKKVIDYLKNRGLSGQIAKQFHLGFAPAGWDNLRGHLSDISDDDLIACGLVVKNDQGKIYDRFRDRLIFPIRDRQGRTIGFGGRVLGDDTPKYLNSPESVIFHKGSELYGLYEAQQANRQLERIIVVEGYMDVIALAQFDISNAVATLGTATTKQNAERLFRYCEDIIFSFDGDNAGRKAAWRALENILPLLEDGLSIRFLFLPEGEDPDTLVREQGKAGFDTACQGAMSCADFLFKHLSDSLDLSSLEGRSRLSKLAEPYIKQVPGKVFQQLMVEELAKRSQMDAGQLRELLGLAKIISTKKLPVKIRSEQAPPSLMQQAISLVVQHPDAAAAIESSNNYAQLDLPGATLLSQLLEKCRTTPNLNTGALLTHWPDDKTRKQLAKLAMRELLIPDAGISNELQGLLHRLAELDHEQKITDWQQKMAAGELSNDEKRAYQALLKQSIS